MGSGSKLIFMTLGCAVNNFRCAGGWGGLVVRGRGGTWWMGAGINHDICASMVTNGSTALIFMYWIQ